MNFTNIFKYDQMKSVFNEMNERDHLFELIENQEINEIRIISKRDNIEHCIFFPENFTINILSFLTDNINKIINEFDEKYFSKPYYAFFGRIPYQIIEKEIFHLPNINNIFYQGFNLPIFHNIILYGFL